MRVWLPIAAGIMGLIVGYTFVIETHPEILARHLRCPAHGMAEAS